MNGNAAEDKWLAQHCPNCKRMLRSTPSLRCWEHGTNWSTGQRAPDAWTTARAALAKAKSLAQSE